MNHPTTQNDTKKFPILGGAIIVALLALGGLFMYKSLVGGEQDTVSTVDSVIKAETAQEPVSAA